MSNFCSDEYDCPGGSQCIDGVCQCTPNAGMYITLIPAPFNVYSMGCIWDEKVNVEGCQKHEYGVEKTCLLNYCSKDVPCFAGECDEKQHICVNINATRVALPKPSHHISLKDIRTPPQPDATPSEGLSPLYIILIAAGSIVGLMIVGCVIRSILLCFSSSARWAFGAKKGAVKLANDETSPGDNGGKTGDAPAPSVSSHPQSGGPDAARAAGSHASVAYPPSPLTGTTLATSPNVSRAPSRASGLHPAPMHSPMHAPFAQQNYSRPGSAHSLVGVTQQVRRSIHADHPNSHMDQQQLPPHMVTIELQDRSGQSGPHRMYPSSAPPSPLKASYTPSVASSDANVDSGVSGIAMKDIVADDAAGYTTIDLNDRSDQQGERNEHDNNKLHAGTSNQIRRSISTPLFPATSAAGSASSVAMAGTTVPHNADHSESSRAIRDSCTLPGSSSDSQGWDPKAKQQLHRSSTTIPTLAVTPAPRSSMQPGFDLQQNGNHQRNGGLLPLPHPRQPMQQQQQQYQQPHQYPPQGPHPLSPHHLHRSSTSFRGPTPPPSPHHAGVMNERTLRHFQSAPNMNKRLDGGNDPYLMGLEPPRPAFAPGPRSSVMSQRPLSTASVTLEARHLPPGFEPAPIARSAGVINPNA
ncbi:hypothetical protein BGW42_002261 [Actinomortierella wolfii]|nr:hypothetical protein BGW42_002261 [Actinomortierella wolfii]